MKAPRWAESVFATERERARREARITIPKRPQGEPDDGSSDRRIIEIGRIARELANPSGVSSERRIGICAGDPRNECDDMLKALDSAEAVLRELAAAPVPVPPKRVRPPRAVSAGRRTLLRPPVRTLAAAKPPAPSAAPTAATSKIAGPSDLPHLDGWNHSAALHYYAFRDRLAGDIRSGKLRPDPGSLIDHAATYGLKRDDAAEWTERFFASIGRDLERPRTA